MPTGVDFLDSAVGQGFPGRSGNQDGGVRYEKDGNFKQLPCSLWLLCSLPGMLDTKQHSPHLDPQRQVQRQPSWHFKFNSVLLSALLSVSTCRSALGVPCSHLSCPNMCHFKRWWCKIPRAGLKETHGSKIKPRNVKRVPWTCLWMSRSGQGYSATQLSHSCQWMGERMTS